MSTEPSPRLTALLKRILDTRSATVIEYLIEDELAEGAFSDEELRCLSRIHDQRSLDLRYAECHEALGAFEKAKELRDWVASKAPRTAMECRACGKKITPVVRSVSVIAHQSQDPRQFGLYREIKVCPLCGERDL